MMDAPSFCVTGHNGIAEYTGPVRVLDGKINDV